MTPRPIAVYTDYDEFDVAPGITLLERAGWEVRVLDTRDRDAIIDGARDATALLLGYAHLDAAAIDALPNLRIIALLAMGSDNCDVAHAAARGIWVSNVPGVATEEVAEHALALALTMARGVQGYRDAVVRGGGWRFDAAPLPKRLGATTCGVLGYGRIGRAFARLAAPIFGEVVVHDPFVTELAPEDRERGIRSASLDEVTETAELLSLHLPLTPETHHLMNAERFRRMPAGAMLVNVSRGELIDEEALRASLDEGHLAAAALDVLATEPPAADDPLVHHARVTITPHIGFLSERTFVEYPMTQARNAVAYLEQGRPLHPINTPAGIDTDA